MKKIFLSALLLVIVIVSLFVACGNEIVDEATDRIEDRIEYRIDPVEDRVERYFERLFKKYSGITPSKYRLKRKIERAKLLLKNPSLTLDAIAEELNFFDSAHLCRSFKNETSLTPSEYRKTVF